MATVVEQMKVPGTLTTLNRYSVQAKEWKKWTVDGRRVFNYLFKTMLDNQALFLHPKTQAVPKDQWRTTCWNAAWEAAGLVSGNRAA